MFHHERGLKITALDLALDMRRRQPRGFVSHAHADHMAPHELALCTPATARFYQRRYGPRLVREMPWGVPLDWDDHRLTTYPAGHVLGSAMLHVERPGESLLYTGDFRLRASATAEQADPPRADTLIMECTFGQPHYRFPARDTVVGDLLGIVRTAWRTGATPIVLAYTLGKSQEVTRLLTAQGIRVRQHPLIHAISRLYGELGCALGDYGLYDGEPLRGKEVLVMPPRTQRTARLPLPALRVTIAVTGWALDRGARGRLGVDYALPFSDHAGYDELLECIERVAPHRIICVHGPAEFADRLRKMGHDARWLSTSPD